MVRVYLKGGVWTNAEDEILKAAVQKYGKQQWARVASLLNKKTAKQAKARWLEWLDPSIRKTEWSRAEEEKLLHLAKLMPAQWRTIAPLVGRTATQCQEHYEALLDQAAGGAKPDDKLRQQQQQLRPGQIDAHPETKPARPDPIDMDEDEMEMLQEARARLANTVGKKAKRKQRERMLAAAKRLADLQKRRELKQAGLLSDQILKKKRKKNKKEIDLGVEIPFYKPAPAGFHDTSSEVARSQNKLAKHLQNVDLKKVNESMYRTRDREAAAAQKRQETRMKVLEQSNQKYAAAAAAKQEEQAALYRRPRGSLQLPAPAVPDTELSQLAKLQQQQQHDGLIGSAGTSATQALLGDYSDRPLPTPMRTPMTASVAASRATGKSSQGGMPSLMEQASRLRQLEQGQTPLLVSLSGAAAAEQEEEASEHDQEDRKQAAVAATPALPDRAGVGQTPSRRDALGLNNIAEGAIDDTASLGASTFATRQSSLRELARQERRAAKKARLDLEAALAALPAPQFEYELAAPDVLPEDEDEGARATVMTVQDQADIEAAEQEVLRKRAEKLYEAQSSVLKRDDLPRPTNISADTVLGEDDDVPGGDVEALRLIRQEALILMQHDAHAHPMLPLKGKGGKSKKSKKRKQDDVHMEEAVGLPPPEALDFLPEEELRQAKDLLQQEHETIIEEKIALAVRDGKASTRDEALEFLTGETIRATVPTEKPRLVYRKEKGWIEATTDSDIMESLRLEFGVVQEATEALRKKNDKVESKMGVMHGGYAKRAQGMKQDIMQVYGETQNAQIEEAVYSMLDIQEVGGGQNRVERLEDEIKSLRASEAELQKRYGELLVVKRRATVSSRTANKAT